MYNCPQVSVSLNDDYSQAYRTDKYLVNFPLLIYWSKVTQFTTFSEKIFHRAFSFLISFFRRWFKMYPRNPQNQSYSALRFKRNRRNQKKYFSLFLLPYLGFIAIDWIKNNRKNRNLNEPLLVFQIWLVGFWFSHSILVVHGLRRSNELTNYFYCILHYFTKAFL